MSSARSAIEAKSIYQSFPKGFWLKETEILHGVSLHVPERSTFGFLGANGAGKTTLIHILAGIKTPRAGECRILGFSSQSLDAKRKVGYLPERPYFYEHLTGREFLEMFGELSGLSKSHLKVRIPKVLAQVQMERGRDLELRSYSKGMLQRIGIAQAILHEPPVLILDEPMSGLDPVGRQEVRDLILGLSKAGHTIFFSTHVVPDIEALCDHVAVIRAGHMEIEGRVEELMKPAGIGYELQIQIEALRLSALKSQSEPYVTWTREVEAQDSKVALLGEISKPDSAQEVLKSILEAGAEVQSFQRKRVSLDHYFHVLPSGGDPS